MIVLALDPGPHTGIAVVSNNSAVLYAMTFEMGEVTVDELKRPSRRPSRPPSGFNQDSGSRHRRGRLTCAFQERLHT
jgi:hypothetical protein